jgi:hypothetical protein
MIYVLVSLLAALFVANILATITLAKRGRQDVNAGRTAQSARFEVTLDAAVQNILHVIADLSAKVDILGAQNNRAIALGDGINAQIANLTSAFEALKHEHVNVRNELLGTRHSVDVLHNHVTGNHVVGREVPRRGA